MTMITVLNEQGKSEQVSLYSDDQLRTMFNDKNMETKRKLMTHLKLIANSNEERDQIIMMNRDERLKWAFERYAELRKQVLAAAGKHATRPANGKPSAAAAASAAAPTNGAVNGTASKASAAGASGASVPPPEDTSVLGQIRDLITGLVGEVGELRTALENVGGELAETRSELAEARAEIDDLVATLGDVQENGKATLNMVFDTHYMCRIMTPAATGLDDEDLPKFYKKYYGIYVLPPAEEEEVEETEEEGNA